MRYVQVDESPAPLQGICSEIDCVSLPWCLSFNWLLILFAQGQGESFHHAPCTDSSSLLRLKPRATAAACTDRFAVSILSSMPGSTLHLRYLTLRKGYGMVSEAGDFVSESCNDWCFRLQRLQLDGQMQGRHAGKVQAVGAIAEFFQLGVQAGSGLNVSSTLLAYIYALIPQLVQPRHVLKPWAVPCGWSDMLGLCDSTAAGRVR